MIVRVELELTNSEIVNLAGKARYLRINPRVAWKKKELVDAARQCVRQLVGKQLQQIQNDRRA